MKTRLFLSAVAFMAIAAIASAQTAQQNPEQIGRGRKRQEMFMLTPTKTAYVITTPMAQGRVGEPTPQEQIRLQPIADQAKARDSPGAPGTDRAVARL